MTETIGSSLSSPSVRRSSLDLWLSIGICLSRFSGDSATGYASSASNDIWYSEDHKMFRKILLVKGCL
jgi:hypothetical protein